MVLLSSSNRVRKNQLSPRNPFRDRRSDQLDPILLVGYGTYPISGEATGWGGYHDSSKVDLLVTSPLRQVGGEYLAYEAPKGRGGAATDLDL